MKKLSLLILAAGFVSSSYALTWTDATTYPPYLKFLSGTGASATYSSTFNITDNGFNPASMLVTSATATFWFADDEPGGDPSETVNILVNGVTLLAGLETDGAHPEANFAAYSVNLNSAGDVLGLIAALQDGVISYQVTLTDGASGGDTYLKKASLTATGSSRGVPDGGTTAAMLGLGLAGLAVLRKRLGLNR